MHGLVQEEKEVKTPMEYFEKFLDSECDIERMNKTFFPWENELVVTQMVDEILSKQYPDARVLDYGAGKKPNQALMLISRGYDITMWEIGKNFVEGVHDPNALRRKYDIVYASNVLNVQFKPECLDLVLKITQGCLDPNGYGIFVANYPDTPRKMPTLAPGVIEQLLRKRYPVVLKFKRDFHKEAKNGKNMWVCSTYPDFKMGQSMRKVKKPVKRVVKKKVTHGK